MMTKLGRMLKVEPGKQRGNVDAIILRTAAESGTTETTALSHRSVLNVSAVPVASTWKQYAQMTKR